MLKQKYKKILVFNRIAAIVIAGVVLASATLGYGRVKADQFDAQIQALKAQNSSNQAASDSLAAQASSYQAAIDALQQRINVLQQNIVDTQNKENDVKNQIVQAQTELEQEKKTLGESIKQMYLESDISPLEILASSNDLSDYVNRQEYRNSVQDKVKTTLDKVNALKAKLEQQQRELDSLLKDLQTQQSQLASDQAQQSNMLAFTEGQKATYDQQIKANNSQISSLRAQQAAANRRLGGSVVAGDPGHGGYPSYLDNAYQDTLVDPWGMYNRECVSYTAWKVEQAYGNMPYWGGAGNANQWPGDARASNIPTGSIPKVGSVAISTSGFYGHAMWVEAVSGSMIYVSQYNYDLAGHYSEMWVNGSSFTYLYFADR
jgi:surface antigen/peptidoglycan hydrolase CwlO-like protein